MAERITLEDSLGSSVIKLTESNPGALSVLMRIVKEYDEIDQDSAFGPLSGLLFLDAKGIYGERIWLFYKDVCNTSLVHMLAVMRACQLGFLSMPMIDHAIDNMGQGIDMQAVLKFVYSELPNFNKANREVQE